MLKKLLLSALFVSSFCFQSFAELTPQIAEQHIEDLAHEAISSAKMDKDNFNILFHKYFDSAYIGRFILGKYWRQATAEQQKEYLKLFNRLVINSYERRFDDYDGETLKVIGTRVIGKDILVKSMLSDPDREDVAISWRLRKRPNGPRIIDVIVEDISLSITQRSEFYAIIEQNNNDIDELIKKLREKTNESSDDQASFMLPDSNPSNSKMSSSPSI